MAIPIIREHATKREIQEMLEVLETYIKLAVDVERKILASQLVKRTLQAAQIAAIGRLKTGQERLPLAPQYVSCKNMPTGGENG